MTIRLFAIILLICFAAFARRRANVGHAGWCRPGCPGRPAPRRQPADPADRDRCRARRGHRQRRPLQRRRTVRRRVRDPRVARWLPAAGADRAAAHRRRERLGDAHAAGGHHRGSHGARHDGGEHGDRRAQLPDGPADHRGDPRQRPQLHRPDAAAADGQRVPAPRQRLGGRARPGDERQWPEPAHQRLPARRHAAERLHQQPCQQRRRHRAGDGDDPRVPPRLEQLQRRVRPRRRRPDERHHQVRHQPARREPASCSTATTPSTRAITSTSTRSRPSVATRPVARWAARSAPTACSSSAATKACSRISDARSSPPSPTTTRAAACCRREPSPISANTLPYLLEFPVAERAVARRRAGAAPLRVRSAAAAALRPGPPRRRASPRLAVLHPLHARRRRTGPADRLPAVPARLRLDQPVPDRASTARRCRRPRSATARFGFSRTHIAQTVESNTTQAVDAVRAGPADDGRHRHRRAAALRPAALRGSRARAGRVQRPVRRDARARASPAQGGRPRRALPRRPSSTRRSAAGSTASPACRRSSPAPPRRSSA